MKLAAVVVLVAVGVLMLWLFTWQPGSPSSACRTDIAAEAQVFKAQGYSLFSSLPATCRGASRAQLRSLLLSDLGQG